MRKPFSKILWTVVFGALVFCFNGGGSAAVVKDAHVEAELIAETESIQPGQAFWVALRLNMDPGWHTYWRNPGDSGIPTSVEWTLPPGFEAGPLEWPYPARIDEPPLTTYGYRGEVFLLAPIRVPQTASPGTAPVISARVRWLACEKICVPGGGRLAFSLPVKKDESKPDFRWREKFVRARSRMPVTAEGWNVQGGVSRKEIAIRVSPAGPLAADPAGVYFFPYDNDLIDHAAVQNLKKTRGGYEIFVKRAGAGQWPVKRLAGILYSEAGWPGKDAAKAVAVDVPALPLEVFHSSRGGRPGIMPALLFALIGGLLLNLMPCVLPVLSIKILGFIRQAGGDRAKTAGHGLVFSAGVLVSFWALAAFLIILRSGGEQIGWGFQLQSPPFLVCLAALFFVLGLNLFGVFEFSGLPGLSGPNKSGRPEWISSFLSGMLATVVATPCTAPFMGSALGFGLTQPVPVSLAVFTCLGAGMALPYLLLSFFPSLLAFIPKPGAWMLTLKQFFGFMLMATVLWLGWVLGLQRGTGAVIALLTGLLVSGFGCWLLGRPQPQKKLSVILAFMLIVSGIVFALFRSTFGNSQAPPDVTRDQGGNGMTWVAFSDDKLDIARRKGRPVFLDFTAAWCLTCQVNERLVLNSGRVVKKFKEAEVIAMKADWTSRNEKVSRALARYGRDSIPFYLLYPPDPDAVPLVLPEILTSDVVVKALDSVERKKN